MTSFCIVTFDGPAASGKSSVSRRLAEIHGWEWVSTGAFYRGLARVARLEQAPLTDEFAMATLAREPFWQVILSPERTLVHYQNRDITDDIYTEQTGQDASQISRFPLVRQALLKAQRDCAKADTVLIAEGRDCGTVVFPNAQLKFYLTAHAAHRAERRALETGRDVSDVRTDQTARDLRDSARTEAPLQVPPDATVIDTTGLDLNAVVSKIDQIIRAKLLKKGS